jgi:hypothetical protein
LPRRRATVPPGPEHPESPPFDALAFKRQTQDELLKATAGMAREEERSFYRSRAQTGPLGAWWARVQARDRSGTVNGGQAGTKDARGPSTSTTGAAESAGSETSRAVARLLDRLEAAIGELGYGAVIEELISEGLIGGNDSLLASGDIMVIPSQRDDASRPILLAVTRGWSGKDPLSFTRVMREVKARLTATGGGIEHVVVVCNAWDSPAFEEEHREELEAHERQGVRFAFVMVGVPDRIVGAVPIVLDHAPR